MNTDVAVFGIGKSGIAYMDEMSNMLHLPFDYVAIATDQQTVDNSIAAGERIRVSKRLSPKDAAMRIEKKLKTIADEKRLCFLIANIDPEERIFEILPEIVHVMRNSHCFLIGLFTTPSMYGSRGIRRKARKMIGRIMDDICLCEFSKSNLRGNTTGILTSAVTAIHRMMEHAYVSFDAVQIALRQPGRMHLMATTMDPQDWGTGLTRKAMRRNATWELISNEKLDTSLHAAGSVLVHISMSPGLSEEDLRYLLPELQGLANADAYMDVAIDIDQSLDGKISVEVLAVGVWTNEEWDETG